MSTPLIHSSTYFNLVSTSLIHWNCLSVKWPNYSYTKWLHWIPPPNKMPFLFLVPKTLSYFSCCLYSHCFVVFLGVEIYFLQKSLKYWCFFLLYPQALNFLILHFLLHVTIFLNYSVTNFIFNLDLSSKLLDISTWTSLSLFQFNIPKTEFINCFQPQNVRNDPPHWFYQ